MLCFMLLCLCKDGLTRNNFLDEVRIIVKGKVALEVLEGGVGGVRVHVRRVVCPRTPPAPGKTLGIGVKFNTASTWSWSNFIVSLVATVTAVTSVP